MCVFTNNGLSRPSKQQKETKYLKSKEIVNLASSVSPVLQI